MSPINDIARLARVSTATVSYVLNGTRPVGAERRQRVIIAIAELQYRPNAVAQSLRRKQTRTIGLVIPDDIYHGDNCISGGRAASALRASPIGWPNAICDPR